jgi:preprotein translocase subunit SecD
VATPTPVRRAWRALTGLLVITALLFGVNALGVYVLGKSSWTPELALDLQGGTQIILEAKTPDGAAPTTDQMNQAAPSSVSASTRRVSAKPTSPQAGNQIVVQIPGQADEETRKRIESSAQMQLRAVLATTAASTSFVGQDGNSTPYPTPDPSLASTPTASPTNGSDLSWITPRCRRSSSPTTARTRTTTRRTARQISR